MKRTLLVIVAAAVILALALSMGLATIAVLRDDEPQPRPSGPPETDTSADADTTQAPDPALEQFYSQQLDWEQCRDNFWCSELEVPLDYADPEGETITIAVLSVRARGDRIGSMVVNPGGPGAPGTDYAAAADRVFGQPILDRFDVVGFDPRGTRGSAPVDCLTDSQLDAYLAFDPAPDEPAEVRESKQWTNRIGQGCEQRSGDLARHVSTEEAARDMDVLRAALGEDTLTYFGASYGTKLGATYADLFPERAGRMVLDGAVDVGASSRDLSLGQAEGFERALRAYVQNCVDVSDDCFLGDSVDAGTARIAEFLDQVDAQPLDTDTDRQLQVGNAFYGIVLPLYSRDYWTILSAALKEAFDGNGTQLLMLADLYASRNADGTYADNSSEAIIAINCLDDPWSVPAARVPSEFDAFEQASPTFGRVFAWGLTGCGGFDYPAAEPLPDTIGVGADPILVVGTTRDPATPYEWSEALAEQLDSGVLLSRDGDGHTAYMSGNTCIDETIDSYLIDGEVPEDGKEC